MARRRKGRAVNGVLLLDKPLGVSSNSALQQAKRIYQAAKAGHTGSLDPLATGMLPICFGEATKFSQYLLDANKTYLVSAKLGEQTSTGDAEGEVIASKSVPELSQQLLLDVFAEFTGDIEQVPPMYSALKQNGQPLYKLARQGIQVERKARHITIFKLQLSDFDQSQIHFTVACSKGTYVRSLVEDIGNALGCGAHVTALRRIAVGPYQTQSMTSIEELQQLSDSTEAMDELLLAIPTMMPAWPTIHVNAEMELALRQGKQITLDNNTKRGWNCLMLENHEFMGVGEVLENNRLVPRRLTQQPATNI